MKKYIVYYLIFSSFYHLHSQEFTVNDVNYKITNLLTKTVEVTTTCYTGNLNLPGTVTYNSEMYTVTAVGNFAFRLCPNIRAVILPNTVTFIGNYAFANSEITSVVIPNSVTLIGTNAFQYCASLTAVTIPDSVTSIAMYTFGNSNISTIHIPSTISSISDNAFENCTNLTTINMDIVIPLSINENVFNGVNKSNVVLNVPVASLNDYLIADVWKDFNLNTLSIQGNQPNLDIKIYPNPVSDMLFIKGAQDHIFKEVSIYTMQGQIITASKQNHLDVSNLKTGLYFVKVTNDLGNVVIKFIKK